METQQTEQAKLCQVIPSCEQQQTDDKSQANTEPKLLSPLPQRTPTHCFYGIVQDMSSVEHRYWKKIE
jgi:hypothetical protein